MAGVQPRFGCLRLQIIRFFFPSSFFSGCPACLRVAVACASVLLGM